MSVAVSVVLHSRSIPLKKSRVSKSPIWGAMDTCWNEKAKRPRRVQSSLRRPKSPDTSPHPLSLSLSLSLNSTRESHMAPALRVVGHDDAAVPSALSSARRARPVPPSLSLSLSVVRSPRPACRARVVHARFHSRGFFLITPVSSLSSTRFGKDRKVPRERERERERERRAFARFGLCPENTLYTFSQRHHSPTLAHKPNVESYSRATPSEGFELV